MAATGSTSSVYPPEIQQLLKEHSKYQDVCSISYGAFLIAREEITEQNHVAFVEELSSMKILYSKLISLRDISEGELKTLREREKSSCGELVKKVPNIEEMPQYFGFTSDQRLSIGSALQRAERRKKMIDYDPRKADQLKALLAEIEPLEIARILDVRLDLAEELKESLPTSFNNPQEPSLVLEDLEATMDSQEPANIIEDIQGTLQHTYGKIEEHHNRIQCCRRLLQKVGYFIKVLGSRLDKVEKETEENMIREQETTPISKEKQKN